MIYARLESGQWIGLLTTQIGLLASRGAYVMVRPVTPGEREEIDRRAVNAPDGLFQRLPDYVDPTGMRVASLAHRHDINEREMAELRKRVLELGERIGKLESRQTMWPKDTPGCVVDQ